MFKKIFHESIYEIIHNKKLIQISFWMGLMHNIYIFGDIIYYINNTLHYKYNIVEKGSLSILNEIINNLIHNGYSLYLFVFGLVFFIGYIILYPLGIALMAFILDKKKVLWGKAFNNYFTIVVISSGLSLFTLSGLHIMNFFRIRIMNISNNILVKTIIIIIILILVIATILTPFVIYSALLKQTDINTPETKFRKAISHSSSLVGQNLIIVIKFIFFQLFLYFRILLNIIIVIGIPSLLGYLFYKYGLLKLNIIIRISGTIGTILFILILYIESIINAFFFTIWYKLYKIFITKEKENI